MGTTKKISPLDSAIVVRVLFYTQTGDQVAAFRVFPEAAKS